MSDAIQQPHPHEGVLVDQLDQVILQLIHQLLWGLPQLLQDVIYDSLRKRICTLISANDCCSCIPESVLDMGCTGLELHTLPHARRPDIMMSQAAVACFRNWPRYP